MWPSLPIHQHLPLLSPLEHCGNTVEAIQLWEESQQLLFASSCHLTDGVRDISPEDRVLCLNPVSHSHKHSASRAFSVSPLSSGSFLVAAFCQAKCTICAPYWPREGLEGLFCFLSCRHFCFLAPSPKLKYKPILRTTALENCLRDLSWPAQCGQRVWAGWWAGSLCQLQLLTAVSMLFELRWGEDR